MSRSARGGLMFNLFEATGRGTLNQLNYVGTLNLQLWTTLRGIRAALPVVGNRHRWKAAVQQMLEIGDLLKPRCRSVCVSNAFFHRPGPQPGNSWRSRNGNAVSRCQTTNQLEVGDLSKSVARKGRASAPRT
jgi:hypothetical protein